MPTRRWRLATGVLLIGAFLSGCSTVVSRVDEHTELFASLDTQTQNTLLRGRTEPGYTMAMAYIAYGPPSETRHKTTEVGESVIWVYQYRYPLYQHSYLFDPYDYYRRDYYYYHPNDYEIRDYRRVVFVDGRITSIEEIE